MDMAQPSPTSDTLFTMSRTTWNLGNTADIQAPQFLRIDAHAHWPTDTFLPAISGTLIARAVVRRTAARNSRASAASWEPTLSPLAGGVAIGVTRGR